MKKKTVAVLIMALLLSGCEKPDIFGIFGDNKGEEIKFEEEQEIEESKIPEIVLNLPEPEVEPEELGEFFPEFREPSTQCKFRGCAHMAEPGCMVKEAVEEGRISASRYENYRLFYEERKNTRKY